METRLNINFSKEGVQNKGLIFILNNFLPEVGIGSVVYLKYTGPEDKKVKATEFLLNNREAFLTHISSEHRWIKSLSSTKVLDEKKLEWLKEIVSLFNPSEIKINLLKD